MKRYRGTDRVEPGIYFCLRQLHFCSLDRPGHLPGDATDLYRRVPAVVLLAAAPLIGLVYVIFLPLIGFLMLGRLLAGKAARAGAEAAVALGRVLRPAWQPAWAFLSHGRHGAGKPRRRDRWAEEVRRHLDDDGGEDAEEGDAAAADREPRPAEEGET